MTEELDGLFETLENDLLSKYEYNLLLNYITNLQKENEILRENAEHNDKVVDKAKWNEMIYKSRNEKAVEYLEHFDSNQICENITEIAKCLLNILKGGDE